MSWSYVLSLAAEKDLGRLDRQNIARIFTSLDRLLEFLNEPDRVRVDTKQLKGFDPPRYRLRVGDYRAVYLLDQETKVITVVRVRKRDEVYR